jgi:hypothetical protein
VPSPGFSFAQHSIVIAWLRQTGLITKKGVKLKRRFKEVNNMCLIVSVHIIGKKRSTEPNLASAS